MKFYYEILFSFSKISTGKRVFNGALQGKCTTKLKDMSNILSEV